MKVTLQDGCQESPGTQPCWEAEQKQLQQYGQQGVQATLCVYHMRWKEMAPRGTSPTCFTDTSTGAAKVSLQGYQYIQHQFQNIPSLCFHLKQSHILPWSSQTSLDSPACPVLSQFMVFLSRSTLSLMSSKSLNMVAGARPFLLYLVSLGSKLTQQKMHEQERNHHKSIRGVSAKGAWRTWHSAQSCRITSISKSTWAAFETACLKVGGPISTAFFQNILFFLFERVPCSPGWPQTPRI